MMFGGVVVRWPVDRWLVVWWQDDDGKVSCSAHGQFGVVALGQKYMFSPEKQSKNCRNWSGLVPCRCHIFGDAFLVNGFGSFAGISLQWRRPPNTRGELSIMPWHIFILACIIYV